MKKIFGLLVFLIIFNSCDDGDLKVESFDFSLVSSATCGEGTDDFFIYKINGNEVLIIELDETTNFVNIETADGVPRTVIIPSAGRVIYRLYNGPVLASTLCSIIPAATPNVIEEWNAVGGTIEITTNVVNPTVEATGSNIITGYNHTITFKNIVFDKGNGEEQRNESIVFGTYKTDATVPVNFTPLETKKCNSSTALFKSSGSQALTLDLDEATFNYLFSNEVTLNTPRTAYTDETNTLTYRVFESIVTANDFCDGSTLPADLELWKSQNGIPQMTGIIEVTTTLNVNEYTHTITLKKVMLQNENVSVPFTFGNNYVFGTFVTVE
jgi:hypothetical protein